jgi:hypothetical protein
MQAMRARDEMARLPGIPFLLAAFLLAGCSLETPYTEKDLEADASKMSVEQAAQLIRERYREQHQQLQIWAFADGQKTECVPAVVGISNRGLYAREGSEFPCGAGETYVIPWKSVGAITVHALGENVVFQADIEPKMKPDLWFAIWSPSGNPPLSEISKALLVLKRAAAAADSEESARFAQSPSELRANAAKATRTEQIRQIEVQVTGAVNEKNFVGAASTLEKGESDAPWWPPFRFDHAIVLAELGDYRYAVIEMQRYLALTPDAPNARLAHDKIYDWQRKATQDH